MAHLIPPTGGDRPALILTKQEALTVLATLNANPTYANRDVRLCLKELIDRVHD